MTKLKIVALSDTHTKHGLLTIPECDVLVHAGDFSFGGEFFEVRDFYYWLLNQPAKHKVLIAGNHEETFDSTHKSYNTSCRNIIVKSNDDNIHYLENSSIEIDGIKFYGTPWTPWFHDWGFNGLEGADAPFRFGGGTLLEDVYGDIPNDIQVLICHGPPYGIHDLTLGSDNNRKGSIVMRKLLESNKFSRLKLYLCGHIHEARGHEECNGVHYCNVSSLGRDYKTVQQPVVINLDENGSVISIQGFDN